MSDATSLITVVPIYGEKKVEPVQYRIVEDVAGPWWWRQKVYWVESDFGRMGWFAERRDAVEAMQLMEGA